MTSRVPIHQGNNEQRELSMFDVFNALLLNRRIVIALPLLFFAVAVAYSMTRPRTWTSDATFMPQTSTNSGQLAGIAAQFGVPIGTPDTGESPAFYAALIHSRAILGAVLDSSYTGERGGRMVTLPVRELIAPADRAGGESREVALRRLEAAVSVSTERETGLITMSAATDDPRLSERVASLLLASINEFNLEKRQVQAAAERRFVEGRLAQARSELSDAETALQRFEEANRRMESPELMLTHRRLLHDVALRQQIVTSLAESFENARIDEVRNLPLITVIDRPIVPERPNGRGTVFRSLFALALGFVMAAAYSLIRATLQSTNEQRPDAELFKQLRREAAMEAARPFRRIVHTFRNRQPIANGGDADQTPADSTSAARSTVRPHD